MLKKVFVILCLCLFMASCVSMNGYHWKKPYKLGSTWTCPKSGDMVVYDDDLEVGEYGVWDSVRVQYAKCIHDPNGEVESSPAPEPEPEQQPEPEVDRPCSET